MSNPSFALAVVASLLVVGMSLGCGTSPTAPTPLSTTAPALPLGIVAIYPTRGLSGETVKVAGTGFLSGATLTLDGVAARVIALTSTVITATTPVHAAGTVDVVVTNPVGHGETLIAGYTYDVISLTASPSLVASGEQLSVSWVAPSGRSHGDWISLFRVGDPTANHGWFGYTDGDSSGTLTLRAPAQPGQYEFRYMIDETTAARSSAVTVQASAPQ